MNILTLVHSVKLIFLLTCPNRQVEILEQVIAYHKYSKHGTISGQVDSSGQVKNEETDPDGQVKALILSHRLLILQVSVLI